MKIVIISNNSILNSIINISNRMINALERNENWDMLYNGISLKTLSIAKPIVNIETLDRIAPLRSFSNSSNSKFIGTCNICCDDIEEKKLHRELPCQYVFHPECVDKWLMECNSTCPMCRKSIYDE